MKTILAELDMPLLTYYDILGMWANAKYESENMAEPRTDTIHIEDLQLDCIIGLYDWEREAPQRVNISIAIPCNVRRAASDLIADAVDYKALSKHVQGLVTQSSFQLIEALLEHLAQSCLLKFSLPWIRLRIDKPGALRGARTVGVEIYRENNEKLKIKN